MVTKVKVDQDVAMMILILEENLDIGITTLNDKRYKDCCVEVDTDVAETISDNGLTMSDYKKRELYFNPSGFIDTYRKEIGIYLRRYPCFNSRFRSLFIGKYMLGESDEDRRSVYRAEANPAKNILTDYGAKKCSPRVVSEFFRLLVFTIIKEIIYMVK